MVSGITSRILALLKTVVGYIISGSRSFVVLTCFGSGAGTMLAARWVGSGCRSSYVPLVPFMRSQQCRSVCQYSHSFGHSFLASSLVKQGFAVAVVTAVRRSNKLATIAAPPDW